METDHNLEGSLDTPHALTQLWTKANETCSGHRSEYRYSPTIDGACSPTNQSRCSDRTADSKGVGQRCGASSSKCKDNATHDSLDTTAVRMVAKVWAEEV